MPQWGIDAPRPFWPSKSREASIPIRGIDALRFLRAWDARRNWLPCAHPSARPSASPARPRHSPARPHAPAIRPFGQLPITDTVHTVSVFAASKSYFAAVLHPFHPLINLQPIQIPFKWLFFNSIASNLLKTPIYTCSKLTFTIYSCIFCIFLPWTLKHQKLSTKHTIFSSNNFSSIHLL